MDGPRRAKEYIDIVLPYGHLSLGNQTDLTLDHGNLPTNKESDPLNICTEYNERTNGRAKN